MSLPRGLPRSGRRSERTTLRAMCVQCSSALCSPCLLRSHLVRSVIGWLVLDVLA
jgi:hypothetical protein